MLTKYFKPDMLVMSNIVIMEKVMETKRERFIRIAESRTNKIIDMIKLLGNCANKSNYEYSDADVQKIFSAIEKELKSAKSQFNINDNDKKFKL